MELLTPTEELSVVVARATGVLLTPDVVDVLLPLLTEVVLETVAGADSCAVTVVDRAGSASTTATSDDLAARADALQYGLGRGPCLEAVRRRTRSLVHDVRTEERWPLWAEAVAALGFRSLLSVPLVAGEDVLGAVKVYGKEPGAFDLGSERVLNLVAAQAAVLLAEVRAAQRGRHLGAGLRTALRHRDAVNTARGIVVHRDRVDEDTAVEVLVATAARDGSSVQACVRALIDATSGRRP